MLDWVWYIVGWFSEIMELCAINCQFCYVGNYFNPK